MDLNEFAEEVGADGPIGILGLGTRGGCPAGVRTISAPVGVQCVEPAEMTVRCAAGTPVHELDDALAEFGQCVAIPMLGTVGGALAVGQSGPRRLGEGPIRDTLLQARYVNSEGQIVKAGGPTVKNVSGFDLCRLLVGSYGTIGFLGEVILRTRPRSRFEKWFTTTQDPWELFPRLYRPTSVLWDGEATAVLLTGDRRDVEAIANTTGLRPCDGPPELPGGGRWSMKPAELRSLQGSGRFVAEIGVGVVHHEHARPAIPIDPAVRSLHARLKQEFDPSGRMNSGIDVLALR